MRKLALILLVLFMAAPSMAAITISAVQDGCEGISINYVCDGVHASSGGKALIAGMAFDVSVDNGYTILAIDGYKTDGESTSGAPGYGVYMKEAQIDMGDPCDPCWVTDGSVNPVADPCDSDSPGQLGSGAITIQFGALFDDPCDTLDNAPVSSGTLCVLTVDETGAGVCTLSIVLDDARGGMVMTDQSVPDPCDVTVSGTEVCFDDPDCMKTSNPGFTAWDTYGKPDCWCYAKQCNGDVDGLSELGGAVDVFMGDLNIFVPVFGTMQTTEPGVCADLDHLTELGGAVNVFMGDLNIFVPNFGTAQPDCDMTHFNFWATP